MKKDDELAEKYSTLLNYFERNFYSDAPNKEDTLAFVTNAISQLDRLLRYSGVKNILCNRKNSINFDNVLKNAEVTLICTRRGDLGPSINTAFGLFCILMLQYSVLRRSGTEKDRIPHFLYIDEFPDFICKATEPIFTVYRKYKVATVLDSQNLSQLEGEGNSSNGPGKHFRDTILANCVNKIIFGNALPEDLPWWEQELQTKREWQWKKSYQMDQSKKDYGYDSKASDIGFNWIPNFKTGKIKSLKNNQIIFKVKNLKGQSVVDKGKVEKLESKYKEPHKVK